MIEAPEIHHAVQSSNSKQDTVSQRLPFWNCWPGQLVRFSIVGGLNTTLDLLVLNGLLWMFSTTNITIVLVLNSLAYSAGALNSFLLNKYWTFGQRRPITYREVKRFVVTTFLGIGCNDAILWFADTLFHPLMAHTTLWMNVSKVVAIAGTVLISYFGMRLWVFVNRPQQERPPTHPAYRASTTVPEERSGSPVAYQKAEVVGDHMPRQMNEIVKHQTSDLASPLSSLPIMKSRLSLILSLMSLMCYPNG